jgi:hypothetical protein
MQKVTTTTQFVSRSTQCRDSYTENSLDHKPSI